MIRTRLPFRMKSQIPHRRSGWLPAGWMMVLLATLAAGCDLFEGDDTTAPADRRYPRPPGRSLGLYQRHRAHGHRAPV
ncbi:MAG: hypothetical protein KatS3mg043_1627 [Rhodothermaceae bacterium]|nr:MAG: hypothetical protein KatS3mg043_1627 [Rhodothermaceae bacterium]